MVDPQWRSIRPPKQVFTNYADIYNSQVANKNYLKFSQHGLEVNKKTYVDFDCQGYVDHNDRDIFKEDSVVEMQFPEIKPTFLMRNRCIYYDYNENEQYVGASIEPLNTIHSSESINTINSIEPVNTINCQIKHESSYPEGRYSPTIVSTSNCYNEGNNYKHMLVSTEDTGRCVETHMRDLQPYPGSMSSLATNNVVCEVNTMDSLSSHFNNAQPKTRRELEAQRRALKRRRKRLNRKRNKQDKSHVYIQCRVSKKLLSEIIKSSISVSGSRLCLE